MQDLFGGNTPYKEEIKRNNRMGLRNADGSWKVNPMALKLGELPGEKCKNCTHLYYNEFAKRYYKCALRGANGRSAASDHRVNWTACVKFERK